MKIDKILITLGGTVLGFCAVTILTFGVVRNYSFVHDSVFGKPNHKVSEHESYTPISKVDTTKTTKVVATPKRNVDNKIDSKNSKLPEIVSTNSQANQSSTNIGSETTHKVNVTKSNSVINYQPIEEHQQPKKRYIPRVNDITEVLRSSPVRVEEVRNYRPKPINVDEQKSYTRRAITSPVHSEIIGSNQRLVKNNIPINRETSSEEPVSKSITESKGNVNNNNNSKANNTNNISQVNNTQTVNNSPSDTIRIGSVN